MARSRVLTLIVLASFVVVACGRNVDPATAVAQARAQIAAGKSGEARIVLKNLAEKQPKLLPVRVLLAQIALDSGDARTADLELSRVERTLFTDAESQQMRMRVDLAMGRAQDVLKALDAPGNKVQGPDAALLRARALRSLGRPGESLQPLRAAAAVAPDRSDLKVEIATSLAATGNLRQALQELDDFLAAQKPDSDLVRFRGELRLRTGQSAKAIEDFRSALSAAPAGWPPVSRISTEMLIAEAQLSSGKTADAKTQIDKIEKLSPGMLGNRLLSAKLALAEGRVGEAVDTLGRLDEVMPDNVQVQYLLIDALLRSGNSARAVAALERRLKQQPTDLNARRMLAQLKLKQNRPDDVLELLAELPGESAERTAETDSLLSVAKLSKQRAGQAIASLTAALAKTPTDEMLRAQLAGAYLMNGEPGRSLAVLREAKGKPPPAAAGVELAAQLALGNDREANQLVKTLVDSPSASPETLLAACDSALNAGSNDIAGRLIDRALQRDATNEGALMRRASLEFSQQRYADARATLELLLKSHPQQVLARIAQARVAEAEGNVAVARTALQTAIKADPSKLEPSLMLAGLELRKGTLPQAIAAIDALIAAAPKDGVAANAAGVLLLNAKRNDEARSRFRLAVDQKADNAEYWFNLGRAQLAAADREAARDSFAAAVERRPDWLEANIAAIRLNILLGDKAAARKLADSLAALAPRNPSVWQLVGEVAAADKRLADAADAFARSYAAQPTALAATREFMVRAALGSARPDQPLLTWLGRNPADLNVRRQLADYYLRTGALPAATEQLQKVVVAEPNDVAALNNLAFTLTSTDLPHAEQFARRANAIDSKNPAIADTLGWVLVQNKKYAEAKPLLQMAAKGMPKDASVQFHYATALARSGDKAAARQVLTAALAGDVKFPDRAAAEQLAQELGQ